ncbi:DUF3306 domain-containing protein [Palleronia caenipelagi]|uniref:DUF3306 domain-containing protein n=1 Tax=Palleronia caenipelagi TaxID=2489174 RepID=A0A547Q9G7_9RHOB|nr:DUF3306 domain-containing protein [Palleronia caenipelagi]TRD23014.1 DUF3306 domain-containing protein [Palleronia caenipelagi]
MTATRTDFWSRRKSAVAAEERAVSAEESAQRDQHAQAALDAEPDAEILARLELPEPEALDSAEAIRGFLAHPLPQRLKQRAIRRLWRLNPAQFRPDGLLDYADDYTDAATVMPALQTAYEVGRGMFKRIEALEAERAERVETAQDAPPEDLPSEVAPEQAEPVVVAQFAAPDADAATPPPRRMRFHFDDPTGAPA